MAPILEPSSKDIPTVLNPPVDFAVGYRGSVQNEAINAGVQHLQDLTRSVLIARQDYSLRITKVSLIIFILTMVAAILTVVAVFLKTIPPLEGTAIALGITMSLVVTLGATKVIAHYRLKRYDATLNLLAEDSKNLHPVMGIPLSEISYHTNP
jgi:hypothetical protein